MKVRGGFHPRTYSSWADIIHRSELIRLALERRGIKLSPQSRFSRYEAAIREHAASQSKVVIRSDRRCLRIARAGAEIDELAFVLTHLDQQDGLEAYLRRVIRGTELPVDQRSHSSAQDFQAELLTAAHLAAGGGRVVLGAPNEEPDSLCEIDRFKFAICVKRLKSPRQLEKRIREASQQLDHSGRLGAIVMDIGPALLADNTLLVYDDHDRVQADIMSRGQAFLGYDFQELCGWVDPMRVGAIMVMWSIQGWQRDRGPTNFRYAIARNVYMKGTASRKHLLRRLEQVWSRGFAQAGPWRDATAAGPQ